MVSPAFVAVGFPTVSPVATRHREQIVTRDDEGVCRRQETAAVMADCHRQESDNDKIGGGGGEDGLVATMIEAAPDEEVGGGGGRRRDLDLGGGIRSPSLLAVAAAALTTATMIPNGEWRDSESSHSGGTARAAEDSNDLPGASAAIGGGSGNNDGRRSRTLTGKGLELV